MLTASDVMTKDVITVSKETTIRELAELFIKHKISSIPLTDMDGSFIGIVTETDLIEQDRNLHIPTVISLFDGVFYLESEKKMEQQLKKMTGKTVEDIYSSKVLTATPETPISAIADIMSSNRYNAVPVVENGRLKGIVSRIDLIRTMIAQGEI